MASDKFISRVRNSLGVAPCVFSTLLAVAPMSCSPEYRQDTISARSLRFEYETICKAIDAANISEDQKADYRAMFRNPREFYACLDEQEKRLIEKCRAGINPVVAAVMRREAPFIEQGRSFADGIAEAYFIDHMPSE